MKFLNFSPHRWGALGSAAILLAATAAVPAFAGPTSLTFNGSVNNIQNVSDSNFAINMDDQLSGTVWVNANADGTFGLSDLQSFDLFVGNAEFNLDSSDFGSFSGALSADGSTLTSFELATFFGVATGVSEDLELGFSGVGVPFEVTSAPGAIASGSYSVTVSAAGGGGSPNAVPEPPIWLSFGLGLVVIGFAMRRRRKNASKV